MRLYFLIKQASVWLRGMLFENMIEQLHITDNVVYNYLISIGVSYLLHLISYGAVGLFYNRGEEPALGSFMYFVAYVNYTFWAWLGLKCYIGIQTTGTFVDFLLYSAIVGIVIINIGGLVMLKKAESRW